MSRTLHSTSIGAFRAMWASVTVGLVAASSIAAPPDVVREINDSLGLSQSVVTSIQLPQTVEAPFETVVPIDGVELVLRLKKHSVLAPDFRLVVQLPDGTYEDRDPAPIRTVRGEIVGLPGSVAVGSLDPDGLRIAIRLPDETTWWVEPAKAHNHEADDSEHVIFNQEHQHVHMGFCGTVAEMAPDSDHVDRGDDRGVGNPKIAQIACDTDIEYSNRFSQNVGNVQNAITAIINTVSTLYENQTGIIYEITTIIVRTGAANSDPYTVTDASSFLGQFQGHWNATQFGVQRDVAHLFTGKNLDSTTIGIAFVGVVCNLGSAYGLSQSTSGNGATSCNTDLTAHELGHNWNAGHCCAGTTMNPSLTCANNFAVQSRNTIIAFKNSRNCLQTPPPAGPPEDFDLITPTPDETGIALSPFFQWEISENAEEYRILVDDNADFSSPIVDLFTITPTLQLFGDPLIQGQQYFWSVEAINDVGTRKSTPLSSAFVTVGNAPAGFVLASPTPGEVLMTDEITFLWTESTGAFRYELTIDDDADFSSPEFEQLDIADTPGGLESFMLPGGNLSPGIKHWKIGAVNFVGTTPSFPESQSFDLQIPGGCDGDADGSNSVDVNDISYIVFRLGLMAPNDEGADVDASGSVDVNDISYCVFRLGTCN